MNEKNVNIMRYMYKICCIEWDWTRKDSIHAPSPRNIVSKGKCCLNIINTQKLVPFEIRALAQKLAASQQGRIFFDFRHCFSRKFISIKTLLISCEPLGNDRIWDVLQICWIHCWRVFYEKWVKIVFSLLQSIFILILLQWRN